jgi:addiction module HigA family antidote
MGKNSTTILPGEILRQDFMKPLRLTGQQLARHLHVPANQLEAILKGKHAISAEMALRLGRFFGVNPETWLVLQANYELHMARQQLGSEIENLIMPLEAA